MTAWRQASACNAGSCVEVVPLAGGGVAVRDGKDPAGPVQRYTAEEWRAFTDGVRAGEFDLAALARMAGDGSDVSSPVRARKAAETGEGASSVSM